MELSQGGVRARDELQCHRRDPALIRALMPLWAWGERYYFRVRSSGWQGLPAGQALYISNHSGGLAAPDMHMLIHGWYRRFGLERPVRGLAHPKLWRVYPLLAELATRVGAIPGHARLAEAALQAGESLLIYPGGAQEAFRPHRQRGRIAFQGRTGFVRLAIAHGLPLVPVVSWGSHDSLLVLEDLYPLARALQRRGVPAWPQALDPEVLPLFLGLPWGIALGPVPNLPLPARIDLDLGEPIRIARSGVEASRDKRFVREVYGLVEQRMQAQLDRLRQDVERGCRPRG